MQLINILSKLKEIKQHVFRTADIMAYFNLNKASSSKVLSRLAKAGHIIRIKRGLWIFPEELEPFVLAEYLIAPFPCYISLQSALYYHGMISQIPNIIYAISIARTKMYRTALGIYSIHHVNYSFFKGYKITGKHEIKMAIPEKALLDFLYLSTSKSRLFSALPEIVLPKKFNITTAKKIIQQIPSKARRTLVKKKFYNIIKEVDLI